MLEVMRTNPVIAKWWSRGDEPEIALANEDLPCPWCRAATREDDPRCPSCGHRFG